MGKKRRKKNTKLKREIIYIVFVGLILLIIMSVTGKALQNSKPIAELLIAETTSAVQIESAFTSGRKAQVNIRNDSNIPITFITTNIRCEDGYQEEVIFGTGYDSDRKQYVPIKLDVGERKFFTQNLIREVLESDVCSIEVIHWSEYGVKE